MFLDFFFVLLVLLILSFAAELQEAIYPLSGAWLYLLLLYLSFFLLALIEKKRKKPSKGLLAQTLLLLFLSLYHFFFGYHLSYAQSKSLMLLSSLSFYFFSLYIFYLIKEDEAKRALKKILITVPFAVPFLFFSAINEFLENQKLLNFLIPILIPILFLCLLLFFPLLLVKFWSQEELKEEGLEELCQKANFSHAGLRIWSIMGSSATAAIIGIIPKFRYILFSKGLLRILNLFECQAVLSHEIAHSKKRHFYYYLLSLLVLIFFNQFFWDLFGNSLEHNFHLLAMLGYLKVEASLFFILLLQACIFFVYLFFIFGNISKQFEKEADFFIFEMNIPVEHMIRALEKVSFFSAGNPKKSSWQHFSIERRILDLENAHKDPTFIEKHKKRLRRIKSSLALALVLFASLSLSPVFKTQWGFQSIHQRLEQTSQFLKKTLSQTLRDKIARKYLNSYPQEGDQELIIKVLRDSLGFYGADSINGLWQYYSAQKLYEEKQYKACIFFMRKAWQDFAFEDHREEIFEAFWTTSLKIVEHLQTNTALRDDLEALLEESRIIRLRVKKIS